MIIGDVNRPNKIPNLNQILFNGDKIEEFIIPKIKNSIESIIDQILMLSLLSKGNIEIIRKNIKKTIPKFLFVVVFFIGIYCITLFLLNSRNFLNE